MNMIVPCIDGVYVNLLDNPERFTGYAGPSAGRIWKSIYEENCFNIGDRIDSKSNLTGMTPINLDKYAMLRPSIQDQVEIETEDTCFEKRVYYRLISGECGVGCHERLYHISAC